LIPSPFPFHVFYVPEHGNSYLLVEDESVDLG
jgi:hypothetical protein